MKSTVGLKRFPISFDRTVLLSCLLMPIVQYGLAKVAIYLSFENGVSAVWPTAGMYLAAVLVVGHRIWPALLISDITGNQLFYGNLSHSAIVGLVDMIDPLLMGLLIKQWIGQRNPLGRAHNLFKFVSVILAVPVVSTTIATITLILLGISTWDAFGSTWRPWYISVIGGVLLVTPMLLSWSQKNFDQQRRWRFQTVLEFAALLGSLMILGHVAFWQSFQLEYMMVPLLAWAAFRFSQRETTLLVFAIAAIAITGTHNGTGTFAGEDGTPSLVLLQTFILVVALTGYVLLAVLNENRQAATNLRKANDELEERVAERTTELQVAKEMADSANNSKSEFLANMSHELRTPLNGILGYAQILQRSEPLTDKGRKGVDIIYQCGSHLLTLINDVLDLSKIEARKLDLYPAPIHFPSFLQGVVEINRIRAEQKAIEFEFHADPQLPVGVAADEKRLRQVLINLLGNAIKFTEHGRVIFKVTAVGEKVRFQIQDTGVGIAPEQVDKIFLPFEQSGDLKKQAEGTGLGLAITHKIVTLMQSQITVESTLGQGSTFSFEVDLPKVEQWAEASRTTQQGQIVGYQGDKQKVLIVDDRWENRSVLVNLLEPIGFEMLEASNGQEGIEQALHSNPDLIITDLAMPVMDGFEFLSKLRSHPKLDHFIVLVSSASVFEIDRQKSIDAGGNDFLNKPVQADTLLSLLQKYLHLNWIYDDKNDSHQHQEIAPDSIQPPAIEVLQQLFELAHIGDLDGILEISSQLQQSHLSFAQELTRLTEAYEIVKLRAFIQQYLPEES
jgi:signal transduction histidine kinase/FixJ family two-component response regulator